MQIVSTDFHVNLEYILYRWVLKNTKLFTSAKAGKTREVVTVNAKDGITYDLQYFTEPYLTKYYNAINFHVNVDKLIKEIARITENTAIEMGKRELTISIKVQLHQRAVVRALKYENAVMYLSM